MAFNSRITKKEQGLIKGSLRRVFARSDLHNKILNLAIVDHFDPSRKRVKKWCLCRLCKKPQPKYLCVVDHIDPVIPVTTSFYDLGADETIDRLWCEENNLQVVCESCHKNKTSLEKKVRNFNKKGKK